eukprot:972500_1
MSTRFEPEITNLDANESGYTKISFNPDLSRFGLESIDSDLMSLLERRVYDVAACNPSVEVSFNGEVLPIDSFLAYLKLFPSLVNSESGELADSVMYSKLPRGGWEIAVCPSDQENFQQNSFVNSIATVRGGRHVEHIVDQLTSFMVAQLARPPVSSGLQPVTVTAAHVRRHLHVFVNARVANPSFDSQTKETLHSQPQRFSADIPQRFLRAVWEHSGVPERVCEWERAREQTALNRSTRRRARVNVPKLEDANWAGGEKAEECTLILTEGDSAKSLARAGLEVVGRDKFGVFPLRGKLLNVRDAVHDKIMQNEEISNVKTIMGLQHDCTYDPTDPASAANPPLRYGRLMLMCDQDHDGSHIKGLVLNFIHTFWPALLKRDGFMEAFVTPIVKANHRRSKSTVRSFFTVPEFTAWFQSLEAAERAHWRIKYYKGLGTSTAAEGREYFKKLGLHRIPFRWGGPSDGSALKLAFSSSLADARKQWLREFVPGTFLDFGLGAVSYTDFVNRELILFSMANNQRSIPSVVDGFKPGQRKVLFACLKRNLKNEIKVAQLAGYVAEQTGYHHGEVSLQSTIVHMAQDFVGANSLPMLMPNGQFGTRHMGGDDSASARYIYTCLDPLARLIFPAEDDAVLKHLEEDGEIVEPEWFTPVVPMVLVNGTKGIGTGFSTSVPSYHPLDVIANLQLRLAGSDLKPMLPWVRGFRGRIEPKGDEVPVESTTNSYVITGKAERRGNSIIISEIPFARSTESFKEHVSKLQRRNSIQRFAEHHTERFVAFELCGNSSQIDALCDASGEPSAQKLGLRKMLRTGNMWLFDSDGKIKKYTDPRQIIDDYFEIRLDFYARRKSALLSAMSSAQRRLSNRVRFVELISAGKLQLHRRSKAELVAELAELKFTAGDRLEIEEDNEETEASTPSPAAFDYLLSLPLGSLTRDRAEALRREHADVRARATELRATSVETLWGRELDRLKGEVEKKLEKDELTWKEFYSRISKSITGKGRASKSIVSGKRKKRRVKSKA